MFSCKCFVLNVSSRQAMVFVVSGGLNTSYL